MRLSAYLALTGTTRPTGVVEPWSAAAVPPGWLLCNGAALNAVTNPLYQRLYEVIGNTYGGSNNTNFVVPDLRGEFVRGADNMGGARGVDPARALGSGQGFRLKLHPHPKGTLATIAATVPHSHTAVATVAGNAPHSHSTPRAPILSVNALLASPLLPVPTSAGVTNTLTVPTASATHPHTSPGTTAGNVPHGHPAVTNTTGDEGGTGNSSETRPDNLAVNFIIKL